MSEHIPSYLRASLKTGKPIVYFDMDGVLCDFDKRQEDLLASGLKQLQNVGADARMATGKAKNQLSTVGQNVSGKVSQVSGRAQAQVEKVGERAKALEAQAQQDLGNVRSAFQG